MGWGTSPIAKLRTDMLAKIAAGKAQTAALNAPPPTPPDPVLAASNAALAAKQASDRARKRAAGAGTVMTGTPGARTPAAIIAPRTLIGG